MANHDAQSHVWAPTPRSMHANVRYELTPPTQTRSTRPNCVLLSTLLEPLPTMVSMSASELAPPSTPYSELDTATEFTGFDIHREGTVDTTSSAAHSGYEGID